MSLKVLWWCSPAWSTFFFLKVNVFIEYDQCLLICKLQILRFYECQVFMEKDSGRNNFFPHECICFSVFLKEYMPRYHVICSSFLVTRIKLSALDLVSMANTVSHSCFVCFVFKNVLFSVSTAVAWKGQELIFWKWQGRYTASKC